jgi:hypothetical protein
MAAWPASEPPLSFGEALKLDPEQAFTRANTPDAGTRPSLQKLPGFMDRSEAYLIALLLA